MDERENWPSVRRPSVREGLHQIRSRTDAMDADGIMEVEGGPQRRRRRRRGTKKRIVRAKMIGKSQQQEEKDFYQETLQPCLEERAGEDV